jgi:arylsulfatase A-like enzyme
MMLETGAQIGRTVEDSIEGVIPGARVARAGAPNIVFIILDDVGFAHYGCFGSSIQTPNIDRVGLEGLRYTNFHTTALCAPTRAALLTGRNPHSVGFGHVLKAISGYPGYSMHLPDSAATIAELLKGNGYSTRAIGKWHLTPSHETGPQGPFDRWPTGRGFQRFYGFLSGMTDQYRPYLHRDNTPAAVPDADDYHLSADLADEAIRQIGELNAMSPDRPFYLHFAPAAGHSPHQAPKEWIDRYSGAFDHGWDVERERVLERQKQLGVVPASTKLPPSNPGVVAWDSLPESERRLYARMQEVYAGYLSYTDAQIGRVLNHLEELGILDNTVVMLCSDNGASGEGGPEGTVDDGFYTNALPQTAEDGLAHIDDLGGPRLQNHYPWGWAQAGNTPFRWYKQFTHAGGITNGLMVRWPSGGITAGELRSQYHHVIDIAPTLLEIVGMSMPDQVNGVTQQPMHGVSMTYSFGDAEVESPRRLQHYEMWGNRGLWREGWMAVSRLQPDGAGAYPPAPVAPFDELTWELYDHTKDPNELNDLADVEPARVRAMEQLWWAEAGRYNVLPVDNRARSKRQSAQAVRPAGSNPDGAVFHGRGGPFENVVAPRVTGRSFTIAANVTIDEQAASGVLYMFGNRHGGYCLYVLDGKLCFEVAPSSIETNTIAASTPLTAGAHTVEVRVIAGEQLRGGIELVVDGSPVASGEVPRLLRIQQGRTYVGYTESPMVSEVFEAPFAFTGVLDRLEVRTASPVKVSPSAERAADERTQ